MTRTTSTQVQDILFEGGEDDAVLSAFIQAATVLTDSVASCASAKGLTLTNAQLQLIETWLAAHFYSVMDQQVIESKTGNSTDKFQGKTDMYVSSTFYGQSAIMFDSSGCLAAFNREAQEGGKRKLQVHWLGSANDESTY